MSYHLYIFCTQLMKNQVSDLMAILLTNIVSLVREKEKCRLNLPFQTELIYPQNFVTSILAFMVQGSDKFMKDRSINDYWIR